MTMQTLTNSYHNTTTRTSADVDAIINRVHNGTADANDRRTIAAIRSRLCGCAGCTCGDDAGRRA